MLRTFVLWPLMLALAERESPLTANAQYIKATDRDNPALEDMEDGFRMNRAQQQEILQVVRTMMELEEFHRAMGEHVQTRLRRQRAEIDAMRAQTQRTRIHALTFLIALLLLHHLILYFRFPPSSN